MEAMHGASYVTTFDISNNHVNEEAANDIGTVLSRNTNLRELYFGNRNCKHQAPLRLQWPYAEYFKSICA